MRPLVWTDVRATAAAAAAAGWLVAIELGTSRNASRAATDAADEEVVDTTTGRIFDVCAAIAIVGGVASSAPGRTTIDHRRSVLLAGVATLIGSGALSSFARRHLGRFHRDALTVHGDHELVDSGPYALVRHPLYTATIAAFVGIGAVLGTWISLALAALPAAAIVNRIRVEERMLLNALGKTYEQYQTRTNRLIPKVW